MKGKVLQCSVISSVFFNILYCCVSLPCFTVGFEAMRSEAIRQDPTRKGSVVNVNPTNTRPQSDTPEIRKYKKRFNSEILCAALWGMEFYFSPYFIAISVLEFQIMPKVMGAEIFQDIRSYDLKSVYTMYVPGKR